MKCTINREEIHWKKCTDTAIKGRKGHTAHTAEGRQEQPGKLVKTGKWKTDQSNEARKWKPDQLNEARKWVSRRLNKAKEWWRD